MGEVAGKDESWVPEAEEKNGKDGMGRADEERRLA